MLIVEEDKGVPWEMPKPSAEMLGVVAACEKGVVGVDCLPESAANHTIALSVDIQGIGSVDGVSKDAQEGHVAKERANTARCMLAVEVSRGDFRRYL